MKTASSFVLLLVLGTGVQAEAPSFSFRELEGCATQRDPYTLPDTVRPIRRGGALVVVVETAAGCSASAMPNVSFTRRSVSLNIGFREHSSTVAACLCARKFEFTLAQSVDKGMVVYLVKDGNGVAHAIAP